MKISVLLTTLPFGAFVPSAYAQTFEAVPALTIPAYDVVPRAEMTGAFVDDFSLTFRTDVLSHFVDQQNVESNNVATQVMEANVRGMQTTRTSVQLTSVESSETARLHIVSTGVVSSNTVGLTPQARVATLGNHTFRVTKPVFFDGGRFLTKPAYGSLQARQIPQAVNSIASGMPLLGRIGDRIARREVYRRMPTSDAIVVRQVADDVLPKINTRVDGQLAELNRKWRDLRQTITRVSGDQQISWAASTTDNSFSLSASSLSTTRKAAVPALTTDLQNDEVIAMAFSQGRINRWLEDQSLGGLTISDTTLQQTVMTFQGVKDNPQEMLQLLKQPAMLSADPLIFSLKLAESAPVSVAFEKGLLTLNVRFQVVPKLAPPGQIHQMAVSLAGQSGADGRWMIALRRIAVEPDGSGAVPDAWTKLIGDEATQMVESVPPSELPRTVDLRHMDSRIPPVRIHRIKSDAGQLRLSFILDASTEKVTARRFAR
ncbi:MAG: hypothetical protein P8J37_06220 [Fuerstiella sp.]|nr:hypothetical protein [Fuerstiella sp.]